MTQTDHPSDIYIYRAQMELKIGPNSWTSGQNVVKWLEYCKIFSALTYWNPVLFVDKRQIWLSILGTHLQNFIKFSPILFKCHNNAQKIFLHCKSWRSEKRETVKEVNNSNIWFWFLATFGKIYIDWKYNILNVNGF